MKANTNTCSVCKKKLCRNEIGLCKKLLSEHSELYCLVCLAELLGCTTEDLEYRIEMFKDEGCTLFG